MATLFGPKPKANPAPPNPADSQNQINDAMQRALQAGGTNADTNTSTGPAVGGSAKPSLTGLN